MGLRVHNDGRAEVRLSQNTTALVKAAEDGELDLSDWDDEELLRGRRRDKNGTFGDRPPKLVPRVLYLEWKKRVFQQVERGLGERARECAVELARMALGEVEYDAGRQSALESVLDRTVGKPVERQQVSAEVNVSRAEQIMDAVTISTHDSVDEFYEAWGNDQPPGTAHDEDIVDAELVDDEPPATGSRDDDWDAVFADEDLW